MYHRIKFVADEALPQGHDFALVQGSCGTVIFYRESAVSERVLEDSWTAYRTLTQRPPVEPTEAVWWRALKGAA